MLSLPSGSTATVCVVQRAALFRSSLAPPTFSLRTGQPTRRQGDRHRLRFNLIQSKHRRQKASQTGSIHIRRPSGQHRLTPDQPRFNQIRQQSKGHRLRSNRAKSNTDNIDSHQFAVADCCDRKSHFRLHLCHRQQSHQLRHCSE